MEIQSYRDLRVWQHAMLLAEFTYRVTKSFPRDELFGMVSQMRRSAASVAANIAEGYGRENKGSYIQFLRIAQGSLKELETHSILSKRVGIGTELDMDKLLSQSEDVGKMLRALIRSLEKT
jgi:four helix bundle protein